MLDGVGGGCLKSWVGSCSGCLESVFESVMRAGAEGSEEAALYPGHGHPGGSDVLRHRYVIC